MSTEEVRSKIRETRREMRAKGIRRISCMNGGLHGEVYSLNARMMQLELELDTAVKAERLQAMDEALLWKIATDS
jgi:preprotein translocase subunit YajC